MKNVVLIISVFVLCSFCLPKERFVSKEAGFSMEVPKGYHAERDTDKMIPVIIYSPRENDKDDFIENINVITQPFEGAAIEYYNARTIGMQGLLVDYKLLDNGSKTVNGQIAHWCIYTFTYGNYTAKILAYYFSFNGNGFAVSCSAKENTFDRYKPVFTKAAESFRKE